MILTAKKGSLFEQTLKELHEQYVRNAKEATGVLTMYYGVKPKEINTSWCLGYAYIMSPLDIIPSEIPVILKKGVKVASDSRLTVDRRTKIGREFLREWNTLDCAKGLSGERLERFGIHTLDEVALKYGYWRVYKTDNSLYCLEVGEYALRQLTGEAKEMMTIDL